MASLTLANGSWAVGEQACATTDNATNGLAYRAKAVTGVGFVMGQKQQRYPFEHPIDPVSTFVANADQQAGGQWITASGTQHRSRRLPAKQAIPFHTILVGQSLGRLPFIQVP